MVEDVPFVQSTLFGSPYSGCASFSGWAPGAKCNVRTWLTSSAASRPLVSWPGPSTTKATHHQVPVPVFSRPSRPYPSVVLGLSSEPYPGSGMIPAQIRKIYPPLQGGRFTVKGPSAAGPFTFMGSYNPATGDALGWTSSLGGTGHSSGLT
jgi:hypothetical protein